MQVQSIIINIILINNLRCRRQNNGPKRHPCLISGTCEHVTYITKGALQACLKYESWDEESILDYLGRPK